MNNETLYYNGLTQNSTEQDLQISYTARLDKPLVNKASDYRLSIVRFDIPSNSIPIFVFDSTPNAYQVSLSINGTDFYTYSVQWIPQNIVPSSNPTYYYCYSIAHWLDLINSAIKNCYDELKITNPSFGAFAAPYFSYNQSTSTFQLLAQWPYYDIHQSGNSRLYITDSVWRFFQAFDYDYFGLGSTPNVPDIDKDWFSPIITFSGTNSVTNTTGSIGPNGNISIPGYLGYSNPLPNPFTQIFISTEYPCLLAWNDCIKIVLTSDSIPVNQEILPAQGSDPGRFNTRSILSDFVQPATGNFSDYRVRISYLPTAQYRYITLNSDRPIDIIDFKVWWVDRNQTFYPIYYSSGESASVKFLFEKIK